MLAAVPHAPGFTALRGAITCQLGSDRSVVFGCTRWRDGLQIALVPGTAGRRVVVAHGHAPLVTRASLQPPRRWSAGGVTCTARPHALVCRDGRGHGWWLGRLGGLRIFGAWSYP